MFAAQRKGAVVQSNYGAIVYRHGVQLEYEYVRVTATSLQEAAELATGIEGLRLKSHPKMTARNFVVAKVWNGAEWAYAYKLPG
jgi:hypothetical protein